MKLSRNQSPATPKSGTRRQRGATIVEAALVFPLLILIIMGIMEIGLAFKDYLTVSYISREAARVGALAGNDADADCAILRGISTVATQGDLNRITSIQIFKADVNGAQGVTNYAVFDGGDPSLCNVPAQPSDTWTINPIGWPATSRKTTVGSQPLDIIGVRIIMTHDWVTNFAPFRGSITIDESTITRLEPKVFE
ncbi:MAG TPA: TadE/TadG family type IV pilus assembly protein [Acidimicrobiia bacterium]|nr:TadE/TadG family type IV pilus assembly protein [Acidimicrobiia bacterium]